tara:strand:- start:644 stop:1171 length:528 start_codon:yes stop_codon:yes gene_type:complete
MSYFSMFPKLFYDHKGNEKFNLQTNLMTRLIVRTDVKDDLFDFDYYNVQDGETPEMIAHKYYDDSELHWTIFLANNIVDYYEDWPMSTQRFEQFVKEKYDNPGAIHHYEITQTSGDTEQTIDVGMNTTDYPSATPISNYTYEDRLQEQKRQIRLIHPRYISQIVEEFENKVDEML